MKKRKNTSKIIILVIVVVLSLIVYYMYYKNSETYREFKETSQLEELIPYEEEKQEVGDDKDKVVKRENIENNREKNIESIEAKTNGKI